MSAALRAARSTLALLFGKGCSCTVQFHVPPLRLYPRPAPLRLLSLAAATPRSLTPVCVGSIVQLWLCDDDDDDVDRRRLTIATVHQEEKQWLLQQTSKDCGYRTLVGPAARPVLNVQEQVWRRRVPERQRIHRSSSSWCGTAITTASACCFSLSAPLSSRSHLSLARSPSAQQIPQCANNISNNRQQRANKKHRKKRRKNSLAVSDNLFAHVTWNMSIMFCRTVHSMASAECYVLFP